MKETMNHSTSKSRSFWLLLLVLPLLINSACSQNNWFTFSELPGLPVCAPFALDRAGSKASVDLKIIKEYTYDFVLRYYYDEKNPYDADRVFVFLRHPPYGQRIPFAVYLDVVRTDTETEQTVFAEERTPKRYTSAAQGSIEELVSYVGLTPGRYRATLDSLQGAPAFKEIKVDFCVTYRVPK